MKRKKKIGGRRDGAGRKPLSPGSPTVTFSIRLTARQKAKLKRLGGGAWVREQVERA